MAWVELAALGFVLLMTAWVFLRPLPQDKNTSPENNDPLPKHHDDTSKDRSHP